MSMNRALTPQVKIIEVAVAAVSAGTEVLTSAVDMQGFESCAFLFTDIATSNAGNHCKVKQSGDSGGSPDTFDDLAGSKVTPSADGMSVTIEIFKPQKRYLKGSIIRSGANTATGKVFAILSNSHGENIDNNVTDVHATEVHVSPDEGTA